MSHDDHRLLAAGAALGDLNAEEWRSQTEHALCCAECTRLGVELRASLADLSLLAPRHAPPLGLRADVLAAVRAEADVARPSGLAATPVPLASRRARRGSLFAAVSLAAVLGVVALGLGATAARLNGDLDQARAEAATLRAEATGSAALMAALADPAHRTAKLQAEALAPAAAAVVVYVPGTTEAWLVVDHMPATPAGRTYQVWYADASGAHPLETATWSGRGVMVAPVAVDLAHSAAVMVTLEPAGGATGEPGPQVVFGELTSTGA